MGICSKRRFFLAICSLQIFTTAIRQTFDFLGYMWTPILTNFFNIIFSIFGFFGGYQYRPSYVISYCVWTIIWLGWNLFVICFYLELGILDKNGDALNMGTGSASWWELNGPGCRASFPANLTGEDVLRPLRPERVTGCILPFEVVEVLQASVQLILGVAGVLTGIWAAKVMLDEDDSSLPASKSRAASLYSIEFSQERPRSSTPDRLTTRTTSLPVVDVDEEEEEEEDVAGAQRAKPMTPRRVKRRSTSRGSTRSRHSHPAAHINPVSRLLEQQERRLVGHCNPTYQSSSIQSLDRPASSYSNYHGQRPMSLRAAAQVPPSNNHQLPINSHRHSYRRHMHQAPPPYNGHHSASSHVPDSETVI